MDHQGEIILLGAGPSVPLGVPAAAAMTRKMVETAGLLRGTGAEGPAWRVLGLVVGELQAMRWRKGLASDSGDINVETVFNAVTMLAERDSIDAAPFVGQWRREVQEVDRMFLDSEDLDQITAAVEVVTGEKFLGFSTREADAFVAAARIALEGKGTAFSTTRKWMVDQLFDFTILSKDQISKGHREFVKAAHSRGATVATLNYDNAIELAATMEGVPCSLGVARWPKTAALDFDEDALTLLKLHGSILWWDAFNVSKATKGLAPAFSWGRLDPDPVDLAMARSYGKPVLLFGGRNKLTADGPFLDLLSEFKRRLWGSTDLRVVGYGFGDGHINATVARWLETGSHRRLHVYDVRPRAELIEAIGDRILRFGEDRVQFTQWGKKTSLYAAFGSRRFPLP